jgi:hypothetical protein
VSSSDQIDFASSSSCSRTKSTSQVTLSHETQFIPESSLLAAVHKLENSKLRTKGKLTAYEIHLFEFARVLC